MRDLSLNELWGKSDLWGQPLLKIECPEDDN